jgi:hypothetical protein
MNDKIIHVPKNHILLSLILFFSFALKANSQDSLLLSEQWKQLKVNLERRTDLVMVIRKELTKAGAEIRREADSAAIYSNRLFFGLNQQVALNQPAIDSLVRLNRNLKSFLGRTFVVLENESKKIKEKISPLQLQLEGVENRIHLATRAFDLYCMETERPECRFQKGAGEDMAPQIRF